MRIKIGIGYDIHRLLEGRKLYLGGIELPFSKGLAGHSDGDCLIHAIIDALLGALGRGDIGQLFPDSDPRYRNIRSTELLESVMGLIREKKGKIHHVDGIIIAEAPAIGPHVDSMKRVLCPILYLVENDIGIKAKTNEGLGAIGRGEAIAAIVQVLIEL